MQDARLKTLAAVFDKGSFTRAADALSLTQPAVSQHISSLEKELGAKLFRRGHGELKPTPEGEIALRYAKRINGLYEKMAREVGDEERRTARIRIGITHTAESNSIATTLAKYASENSGASITIITDTISNLYDMLSNYELDLAVVEGRLNVPGINALLLDTDYLVCAVANDNPLAQKNMATLNDIKKEKLILRLPSSGTRNLFVSSLERLNMSIADFNVVLEVDNIATIKDFIRKGMGISILARSACLDELSKGKLKALPVENLSMTSEINIIYQKDFGHEEILQALTRIYREITGGQ